MDRAVRPESWRPGCNRCASKVPAGKRCRIEGSDPNRDSRLTPTPETRHQGVASPGLADRGNILPCNYNPGAAAFPPDRSIKASPVAGSVLRRRVAGTSNQRDLQGAGRRYLIGAGRPGLRRPPGRPRHGHAPGRPAIQRDVPDDRQYLDRLPDDPPSVVPPGVIEEARGSRRAHEQGHAPRGENDAQAHVQHVLDRGEGLRDPVARGRAPTRPAHRAMPGSGSGHRVTGARSARGPAG